MSCEHSAGGKVWIEAQNGIIKQHPYCMGCGTIKNVSSDRGKKMGYFVSAISKLRKILEAKGLKISEAQIRLIFKELPEDFEDTWWITFSRQKEIFVKAVKKYVRVSEDLIRSVL